MIILGRIVNCGVHFTILGYLVTSSENSISVRYEYVSTMMVILGSIRLFKQDHTIELNFYIYGI